ncbi:hypothetical protein L1887_56046 [Cichorium endivia]|nr:hypothetical protein L1887_56046 [Cichorium endivia]
MTRGEDDGRPDRRKQRSVPGWRLELHAGTSRRGKQIGRVMPAKGAGVWGRRERAVRAALSRHSLRPGCPARDPVTLSPCASVDALHHLAVRPAWTADGCVSPAAGARPRICRAAAVQQYWDVELASRAHPVARSAYDCQLQLCDADCETSAGPLLAVCLCHRADPVVTLRCPAEALKISKAQRPFPKSRPRNRPEVTSLSVHVPVALAHRAQPAARQPQRAPPSSFQFGTLSNVRPHLLLLNRNLAATLEADLELDGLAQESLKGLERLVGLGEHNVVAAEDGGDEHRQLHHGHVASDARTRAHRKGDEGLVKVALGVGCQPSAVVDTSERDTRELLDRLEAVGKPGQLEQVRTHPHGRQTHRRRELAALVDDLDRRAVVDLLVAVGILVLHLGLVDALFEHAKRASECERADRVKRKVVEPQERVEPRTALDAARALGVGLGGLFAELIPALEEQLHLASDEGLECYDGLGCKRVRYDLSLARVLGTVARVEQTAREGARRHKGVVVGRLERAGAVTVDRVECVGVSDGDVVGARVLPHGGVGEEGNEVEQEHGAKNGNEEVARLFQGPHDRVPDAGNDIGLDHDWRWRVGGGGGDGVVTGGGKGERSLDG